MLVELRNITYGTREVRELLTTRPQQLTGPPRTIRALYEVPAQTADLETELGAQLETMSRRGSAVCRQLWLYDLAKDAHLQHNKLSSPVTIENNDEQPDLFVLEYTVAKPLVVAQPSDMGDSEDGLPHILDAEAGTYSDDSRDGH